MNGYKTASTPSPISNQEEIDREDSVTPNCSLLDVEQRTLLPETEDSLYVNTWYSGDSETTISQTPAPVRDYANAVVTGSYMNQNPGPAYRLRSMTRGLTKPRYILKELITIVKDDIKEDDKAIKDRKDKADEVFTLIGVGE